MSHQTTKSSVPTPVAIGGAIGLVLGISVMGWFVVGIASPITTEIYSQHGNAVESVTWHSSHDACEYQCFEVALSNPESVDAVYLSGEGGSVHDSTPTHYGPKTVFLVPDGGVGVYEITTINDDKVTTRMTVGVWRDLPSWYPDLFGVSESSGESGNRGNA